MSNRAPTRLRTALGRRRRLVLNFNAGEHGVVLEAAKSRAA